MANIIEIELPRGTDSALAESLAEDLRGVGDVRSSELARPKVVDPASLIVWVKLASAALPVLTSLVTLLRGRQLKNVRIKSGDKVIEVDSASAADVESLVTAMRGDD